MTAYLKLINGSSHAKLATHVRQTNEAADKQRRMKICDQGDGARHKSLRNLLIGEKAISKKQDSGIRNI